MGCCCINAIRGLDWSCICAMVTVIGYPNDAYCSLLDHNCVNISCIMFNRLTYNHKAQVVFWFVTFVLWMCDIALRFKRKGKTQKVKIVKRLVSQYTEYTYLLSCCEWNEKTNTTLMHWTYEAATNILTLSKGNKMCLPAHLKLTSWSLVITMSLPSQEIVRHITPLKPQLVFVI